jgi:hypothetical protein
MGPAIYGMLAREGQVPHGSVALRPLEKTPKNESPPDGVAENGTAPSRKEGLAGSNGEGGHDGTRSKELDHMA